MRIEATRQITRMRPDKTPPGESRQDLTSKDPDNQGSRAEPGPAPALTAPQMPVSPAKNYRPATFLAHLIATREQAPQTRERRRAEPGEAVAAYKIAAGLTGA